MDEFVGRFMAFKGEDEYGPQGNILLEVTDLEKDGTVEIAFNAPLPGSPRIYVAFKLSELVQQTLGSK